MNEDIVQIENHDSSKSLFQDIKHLIETGRSKVAVTVNTALTLLYWQVGQRIHKEILGHDRAEYGKQILQTLAAKLSWSHFKDLIYIQDPLKREFYAEMCRHESWSVRTLRKKIDAMLFERTALSKKPDEVIVQELQDLRKTDKLSPDLVFRDPYFLDFLGLRDRYVEKDIEDAILRELEHFLLELGSGFAFLARQKRFQLDNDDYYIDLLFYHRHLNRLIAIDLKLGDFKAQDKGQMELYLRWLAKNEQRPDEKSPLGIILCAGKKQDLIELMELGQSGIHVAEYLTLLPEKDLLKQKLHDAISKARLRLENRRTK
jgi:predicted nuclease of restriction endonuclease-like (RecB) superfamily